MVANRNEILRLDGNLVEGVEPALNPASHLLKATVGCGVRKLSDLHDHGVGVPKLPVLGRVADVSSSRSFLQQRSYSHIQALCGLHVFLRHRYSDSPTAFRACALSMWLESRMSLPSRNVQAWKNRL